MEWVVIIMMLALVEYIYFAMKAGAARGKYGVKAPEVTGHEMFERNFRVQYNTLEQLIIFIPGIWAFGYYIGYIWAAGLGAIYLVGRLIYAISYIKEPAKRGTGMIISVIPVWIMVLGALVGAVWQLVLA